MLRVSRYFRHLDSYLRQKLADLKSFSVVRSPLSRRLLLLNLFAPALLVAGLFYMDHYQKGLIDAEIKVLKIQAELMAVAVSEGAVNSEFASSLLPMEQEREQDQGYFLKSAPSQPYFSNFGSSGNLLTRMPREIFRLLPDAARRILLRLPSLETVRVRLFDHNGVLTADSRLSGSALLPQITTEQNVSFLKNLFGANMLPRYEEAKNQTAFDYQEVGTALGDGVRAGHTSKKMIEAYEQGMQ